MRSAQAGCSYIKIGARVLYRVEDVLAYENANYVEVNAA